MVSVLTDLFVKTLVVDNGTHSGFLDFNWAFKKLEVTFLLMEIFWKLNKFEHVWRAGDSGAKGRGSYLYGYGRGVFMWSVSGQW